MRTAAAAAGLGVANLVLGARMAREIRTMRRAGGKGIVAFERFLTETARGHRFDVMLEAKAKDLALLRLRDQLAQRGIDLGESPLAVRAPAAPSAARAA